MRTVAIGFAGFLLFACGGIVERESPQPVPQDAGADDSGDAGDGGLVCAPGQCMGCLGGTPCQPYCYTCQR